jgi:hypothetical protein
MLEGDIASNGNSHQAEHHADDDQQTEDIKNLFGAGIFTAIAIVATHDLTPKAKFPELLDAL